MVGAIKETSWLADLINTYNQLGGVANYKDVYPLAKQIRLARGGNWTAQSNASIRQTVEYNSKDSAIFRGREVFYSVKGIGKGTWGLLYEYLEDAAQSAPDIDRQKAYLEGVEGIVRESNYLRKSRDPKLVEQRKLIDDFTCQACEYRKQVGKERFIIDVHHLNPIGDLKGVVITSIDDLVCLCPNCHRIAHSRSDKPLNIAEIINLL